MLESESTLFLPMSLNNNNYKPHKDPDQHTGLYLSQPYAHAVIQLVEVAPPPRRLSSVFDSSPSDPSSSSCSESASCDGMDVVSDDYYDDSDDEEEDDKEDDKEEDEEEEIGSSYCSSDFEQQEALGDYADADTTPAVHSSVRNKRILLWRAHSQSEFEESSHIALEDSQPYLTQYAHPYPPSSASSASSSTQSRKRKLEELEETRELGLLDTDAPNANMNDDENLIVATDSHAHASKRSRSSSPFSSSRSSSLFPPTPPSLSPFNITLHTCPACDAHFSTIKGLRLHGQLKRGTLDLNLATDNDETLKLMNEACCVAVDYALEH